eukprot:6176144-Pleurochrysis_carterae.AAC.3
MIRWWPFKLSAWVKLLFFSLVLGGRALQPTFSGFRTSDQIQLQRSSNAPLMVWGGRGSQQGNDRKGAKAPSEMSLKEKRLARRKAAFQVLKVATEVAKARRERRRQAAVAQVSETVPWVDRLVRSQAGAASQGISPSQKSAVKPTMTNTEGQPPQADPSNIKQPSDDADSILAKLFALVATYCELVRLRAQGVVQDKQRILIDQFQGLKTEIEALPSKTLTAAAGNARENLDRLKAMPDQFVNRVAERVANDLQEANEEATSLVEGARQRLQSSLDQK